MDPNGLHSPLYAPFPAHLAQMGTEVDVQKTSPTLLISITYCLHLCMPEEAEQPGETPGMFAKAA